MILMVTEEDESSWKGPCALAAALLSSLGLKENARAILDADMPEAVLVALGQAIIATSGALAVARHAHLTYLAERLVCIEESISSAWAASTGALGLDGGDTAAVLGAVDQWERRTRVQ